MFARQINQSIKKRLDLRGDIHAEMESNLCFARDVTRKPPTRVWSQHCITQHSKVNSKVNADYGDEDDEEEEYDAFDPNKEYEGIEGIDY